MDGVRPDAREADLTGAHRGRGGKVPLRVMRSRVEVCVNMFQLVLFDVSSFVS
jgi:hypothetical protein